jgi:dGTPase
MRWPGLELASWPSLEAQVAAIADDIAYDNHDIDDGLRSGILDLDALLTVPIIQRHWSAVEERHPGLDRDRKIKALVRDGIGAMVSDVLKETRCRIAAAGVHSIDDVRAANRQLVGFSATMQEEERALKRHLYDHLYDSAPLTPDPPRSATHRHPACRHVPRAPRLPSGGLAPGIKRDRADARDRRLYCRND